MKLKAQLAMTLVIPMVIFACAAGNDGATELPELPPGWTRYTDKQNNYSIGYPNTWRKEDSGFNLTSIIDPETGVGIDIGVGRTDETNLIKYVSANKIHPSEGAIYLHEGPITINGMDGYELVLTLQAGFFGSAFQPGVLKHRQIVFISQRKAYVITATALEEEYDDYDVIFEGMVSSFSLPGS